MCVACCCGLFAARFYLKASIFAQYLENVLAEWSHEPPAPTIKTRWRSILQRFFTVWPWWVVWPAAERSTPFVAPSQRSLAFVMVGMSYVSHLVDVSGQLGSQCFILLGGRPVQLCSAVITLCDNDNVDPQIKLSTSWTNGPWQLGEV